MLHLIVAMAIGAPSSMGPILSLQDYDPTHARWTDLLVKHVKDGAVDYQGMKKDKAALETYLTALESVPKETYTGWSDQEKIAFWINAYNAYTVKLIVDNFPVKSIKDLSPFLGSVFNKSFIPLKKLHGANMSLNAIEHDTLRATFAEPRVHFALVCASKSCPPLRNEAYRGKDLNHQLDDQARVFLKDSTKNRYDPKSNTLHLSKIFDWFEEDFKKTKGSVRDFVAQYLEVPKSVDLEYLDYDWSLNGR